MSDNENKNTGFSFGGSQNNKSLIPDLPERPLPKPISKEGDRKWTPEIPEELREKPVVEENTKKLVLTVGNVLLPLIGLTIIIGGIFLLVNALLTFYATS